MKTIIVLLPLLAIAFARPQAPQARSGGGPEADAVITKLNNDNIGTDGYSFDFATSNGIQREETGKLNNIGTDNESLEVHGGFSSPVGGKTVTITFVADENGYRPKVVIA